jgi:endonuclease YncB( thermonuclease family)
MAFLLALALAAQLGAPAGMAAQTAAISGVARVIDGDTIIIGATRIRLEGIDAPEAAQTCARRWLGSWPCGRDATDQLARLLGDREVRCERRGEDNYQRVLGVCFVDAVEVNAEMVRRGLAWAFVKYSQAYVGVEAEAKAQKAGIWQGHSQPAWEFRHQRWTIVEGHAPAGCAIKGNVTKNGRIYHMPWSPWYDQIAIDPAKGKRWFCSEAEATAAGWRPARMR